MKLVNVLFDIWFVDFNPKFKERSKNILGFWWTSGQLVVVEIIYTTETPPLYLDKYLPCRYAAVHLSWLHKKTTAHLPEQGMFSMKLTGWKVSLFHSHNTQQNAWLALTSRFIALQLGDLQCCFYNLTLLLTKLLPLKKKCPTPVWEF